MSVAERLKQLIKLEGSQGRFSQKTGLSPSTISKTLQRETNLGGSSLEQIAVAYPNLNLRWLLTGEGSMWMNEKPASAPTGSREVREPELTYERLAALLEHRVRELERELKQLDPEVARRLGIK